MIYRAAKPLSRASGRLSTTRLFHSTVGTFVSLNSKGRLVREEVKLIHGNYNESYILIPQNIGYALQASIAGGNTMKRRCDQHSLTYFHETKTFAHESPSDLPRLEISQDLPRQTNTDRSPATLFLDGVSHEIALDGTPDAKFAEAAAESYRTLKPALDLLRNM